MIEFPVIETIYDVLPHINGRDEFVVADKGDYTVINYNVMFEDTFLYPEEEGILTEEKLTRQMRRECRGIIFCSQTGKIVRRPYHKFKNVNEAPETQHDKINLSQPHAILEKLDGSMICPFVINGEMIWGTKMGATDVAKPVEEFVKNNPQYVSFANWMLAMNLTPIFEWCSRKQRIVLDYNEDQLILTAIRHLHDGHYVNRESMIGFAEDGGNIPVVRAFEPQTDMKDFLEYVHDLEDLEGFVVRFDDGMMVKLKCHWYVQIHKAKEAILQDRNIVELILEEKLDDVKAHLTSEERDRLTVFESEFNHAFNWVVANTLAAFHEIEASGIDRKTFALGKANDYNGYIRPILFRIFGNEQAPSDLRDIIANVIRNNLGRTAKYEAIREAWFPGIVYNA